MRQAQYGRIPEFLQGYRRPLVVTLLIVSRMTKQTKKKERSVVLSRRRPIWAAAGGLAVGLAVAIAVSAAISRRAGRPPQVTANTNPAVPREQPPALTKQPRQQALEVPREPTSRAVRETTPEVRAALLEGRKHSADDPFDQAPAAVREPAPEVKALLLEGRKYLADDIYDRAREAFERARTLAPDDPWPPYALGRVELALARALLAEQRFREALKLDPRFVPALTDLAMVLGSTGNFKESVPLLEQAQAEAPDDLSIRVMLGKSLLGDDQIQRATEVLEGCRRWPGADRVEELFVLLGQAYTQAGNYGPAREALEKALQLNPKLALPHFWLSQILMKTGHEAEGQRESALYQEYRRLEGRIVELSFVVASQPSDVESLRALAQALLDRGLPEAAT